MRRFIETIRDARLLPCHPELNRAFARLVVRASPARFQRTEEALLRSSYLFESVLN
jgi:hypothetical protein